MGVKGPSSTPEVELDPVVQPPARSAVAAVIITALLTAFVAATYGFGIYLFAQLVTDMRQDLSFGFTAVGTITALGQLGFLVGAAGGAWAAARVGGAIVVIGSVATTGGCLLLVGLADNVVLLAVLLTLMGAMAASVYVPMVELVSGVIAYRHRGMVLGLVSSGTSFGVLINSLLVPVFVAHDNWRGVWYVVGGLTVTVTLAATTAFWRYGLFSGSTGPANVTSDDRPDPDGPPVTSQRGPSRRILVPWVMIILAITFLNGLASGPFQNYLSSYLREERGFSVGYAATIWGVIGVIGMVSGFAVGWLSDRTGVRAALVFSYTCFFIAALLLVVAPVGWVPLASGILFAVAFYPVFGLVPAYVSKTAAGATATTIFGLANVTQGLGGMSGNYLAGILKNATGGFVWIYIAIAASTVVLGTLSLALPREGSPPVAVVKPPTAQ